MRHNVEMNDEQAMEEAIMAKRHFYSDEESQDE